MARILVEFPEGIDVSLGQIAFEALAFLQGKSGVALVGLGIFQVDFGVGHVQVTAEDYGLGALQGGEISEEGPIPFHAVCETHEPLAGIGRVDIYEEKVLQIEGDDAAFAVVLCFSHAIGDRDRFPAAEDRSARVALSFGAVPVGMVTLKVKGHLLRQGLGLLQAEDIRYLLRHELEQPVLEGRPDPVDVP